jgi:hypothetical protein
MIVEEEKKGTHSLMSDMLTIHFHWKSSCPRASVGSILTSHNLNDWPDDYCAFSIGVGTEKYVIKTLPLLYHTHYCMVIMMI